MTSLSSGYITVRRNLSDADPDWLKINVSVPAKHAIMVSFEHLKPLWIDVTLFRYFNTYSHSNGRSIEKAEKVWERYDTQSDFVHLLHATGIGVRVLRYHCMHSACFKLWFTLFHERDRPAKLPSGLWNCSVEHYYDSFHQHVACNLKTECEDGRDETGDCPYSSAHCQGLIALCGRCYNIVDTLRGFNASDNKDLNVRAAEYCRSIGAKLSLPGCVNDWGYSFIQRKKHLQFSRLGQLFTGLYVDDRSLPRMYVHSVTKLDGLSILHHTFTTNVIHSPEKRRCLQTKSIVSEIGSAFCEPIYVVHLNKGAVCELTENRTERHTDHSTFIPLASREFVLSAGQQPVTQCADGHVTHTFLLCGSNRYKLCRQQPSFQCQLSDQLSSTQQPGSPDNHVSVVSTFTCNDQFTLLSYSLVCDFITDCPDNSDESFCKYSPCNIMFKCSNGECLSFDIVCDYVFHCQDKSDENCAVFRLRVKMIQPHSSFPAFVNFDGDRFFISTPLNSTESCPDSHYRCPGDYNDCLPVYTRCNGVYDCIDHQDEDGCEEMKCPGFFRCRLSKVCLHSDFMCDGWPHCPMNDDELSCDVACPVNCLCQGHTFLCPRPFSAASIAQLRYLDATGSGMTLSDVTNGTLLIGGVFAHCYITHLPRTQLVNLRLLDLSGNKLKSINMTLFVVLENLEALSLSDNPLGSLHTGPSSVKQHSALAVLDLSHTTLTVLDTTVLALFPRIQKLNLTSTSIHAISLTGFQFTPQLTALHMDGSPVKTFPPDIFKDLYNLRYISTENYRLCCKKILPDSFDDSGCSAPKDEISSCEDLLRSWTYRGCLWLMAGLSVTGNVFCCCARLFAKSMASSSSFGVFVTNLTLADFLMGVYIAIIGGADERFRGRYLHNDDTWKSSVACKVAGVLSLLSSEVSALIIWFITLDRFLVIRFPFSTVRFDRTSASVACLLTWLAGWLLALLPLFPVTSHWNFYGQTGICIPLPITRREFAGSVYSFSVLIVLNLIIFFFISAGQAFIYWSIQDNTLNTNSTRVSRDMTIARRLITIAVTDFLCWFPIGLCGMLALAGTPIPGEVNVALSIFVLPLNSALNPFMYTFNTLTEKRKKSNEVKLLNWMESHHHLIADST